MEGTINFSGINNKKSHNKSMFIFASQIEKDVGKESMMRIHK